MPPKATTSSSPQQYSSFLEVVLDHVCCNAESNSTPLSGSYGIVCEDLTCGAVVRRARGFNSNAENGDHPLILAKQSLTSQFQPLAETILPHLRFRPLLQPTDFDSEMDMQVSSLDDFYTMFLADDAPHSFKKFHETWNGDENVKVTPWKRVKRKERSFGEEEKKEERYSTDPSTNGALPFNIIESERTITFQTGILSPSSSTSSSDASNPSTLTLGVIVTQRLLRLPFLWILECEFSFDFSDVKSESVGGRFGLGLGQFLVSNDVKGSTVNVRVTLREGEDAEIIRGPPNVLRSYSAYGSGCGAGLSAQCNHETFSNGCLNNCFSHPVLLPPEKVTTNITRQSSSSKSAPSNLPTIPASNSFADMEEDGTPSAVGASLLHAIQAKNSLSDSDWKKNPRKDDIHLAVEQLTRDESDTKRDSSASNINKLSHDGREDVLSCTSHGSLKDKNLPSFEISRAPSNLSASEGHIAMRRMLLEKDGADQLGTSPVRRTNSHNSAILPTIKPLITSTTTSYGLSMRMEMEVCSPPPSASSSLSSFSRSKGSFTNIDDKVRRGLKKRVSRTWVTWAESWCMRLWEEEAAERQRRKMMKGSSPIRKRTKINVRPIVRRLTDSERDNGKSDAENGSSVIPSDWNPLQVSQTKGEKNKNGIHEDSFRWKFVDCNNGIDTCASIDAQEEHGVEVSCTVSSPQPHARKSQYVVDCPQQSVRGGITEDIGKTKNGRKLLQKQNSIDNSAGYEGAKTSRWGKSLGGKNLKLMKMNVSCQ